MAASGNSRLCTRTSICCGLARHNAGSRWVMELHEGLTLALVFRRSRISVMRLRNPNELTMQQPRFRLKVNLSCYFQDARRLCCILIDGAKMQQIEHIKQHIAKLFDITDPFHLLLRDHEYLPPTEDICVLNENETIKVVPGTGIHEQTNLTTSTSSTEIMEIIKRANAVRMKTYNGCVQDNVATKTVRTEFLDTNGSVDIPLTNAELASASNTMNSATCHTSNESTEIEIDSNITDSNVDVNERLTENDDTKKITKRKRTRRRKSKNIQSQEFAEFAEPLKPTESDAVSTVIAKANDATEPKKPKIIDTVVMPSAKYIRFSDVEDEEGNIVRQVIVHETPNHSSKSRQASISPSTSLSNLLSLRHNPTVLTFSKPSKNTDDTKDKDDTKNTSNTKTSKQSSKIMKNSAYKKEDIEDAQYLNLIDSEIEDFPIMTRKPTFGDIIAFKILKMADDYTPQISNFIISKVLNFSTESTTHFLKIIRGAEEIEVPQGKFYISDNQADEPNYDCIPFTLGQMMELRLLS